jgi:hypothetical protein
MRTFCALALILLAFAIPQHARAAISLGINYNWWKFSLATLRDCKAEGDPRTTGVWILPSYDDPKVRSTVNKQLHAMRASGFTTMRIVIFHDRETDPDPTSFVSMDGSIARADRRKLHDFVGDIAAAGFTTLEIVPDFGAENWLYCRNAVWGDCFEPSRTAENWRFIEQATQTALSGAGGMRVRVDLANEQAPDPAMPPRALAQAKTYLQTLARRFSSEFGDRWLISAARSDDSTAAETRDRLELLVKDLAAAGLTPKFLELHDYSFDGNDMQQSLDALQAIAQRIGARVVLGELAYHNAVQAAAIRGWLARNPASRIVDLIQWPEFDPRQACAMDPLPPYTPGPLERALP